MTRTVSLLRTGERPWWVRSAQRACLLLMVALIARWGFHEERVIVALEVKTTAGTSAWFHFASEKQEHNDARRTPLGLWPDGAWHRYHLSIPVGRWKRVLFAPDPNATEVAIRAIDMTAFGSTVSIRGDALPAALGAVRDARIAPSGQEAGVRFTVVGERAAVEFNLPRSIKPRLLSGIWEATHLSVALALAYLVFEALSRIVATRVRFSNPARRLTSRLALALSEERVLCVSPGMLGGLAMIFATMALYVGLDLHQSSIGVWEEFYPAQPVEQLVDLGTARRIRSDEWNTASPWALSQVFAGGPESNESIGGERSPLLMSMPVAHPSSLAQLKFLGFALFDAETGFSWWWAYKAFGLFLSYLWLLLILTRGCVGASLLGASWIYGSSFVQWWFSSNLPELMTAFALTTIGAIYLLLAKRRPWIGVGGFLSAYGIMNLVLHLYPPFIIPLFYVGIAIVVGLLLEPGRLSSIGENWKWRAGVVAAGLLALGSLVGLFMADAWETMQVMLATVYPGQRTINGGTMSLPRTFYGFFEALRFTEHSLPLHTGNASEASAFILLAPVALLVVPVRSLAQRSQALLTSLLACFLLLLVWIAIPLPEFGNRLLQWIGLGWSQPERAVLGLGVASIVLLAVLCARVWSADLPLLPLRMRLAVPIVVAASVLAYGLTLKGLDPTYFTWRIVITGTLLSGLMAAGLAFGRPLVALGGLTVALIPTLAVNPLMSGLSAILEKPALVAAKAVGGAPEDKWIVVGDFVVSQGLKAQGLTVLTGTHGVPNSKMMHVLDPHNQWAQVWNRYGHVVVRSDSSKTSPKFDLIAPDMFAVTLDVCAPELRRLGVTRVAYTTPAPLEDMRCLTPLRGVPESGISFFELTAPR